MPVAIRNLSPHGALVHGFRPLRPAAVVRLLLLTSTVRVPVSATVLRCTVCAIGPGPVVYQAALCFDAALPPIVLGSLCPDGAGTGDPRRV